MKQLVSVYILRGIPDTLKERFFDPKRNGKSLTIKIYLKYNEHFIQRVFALQTLVLSLDINNTKDIPYDVPKDVIKCFRLSRRSILSFLEHFPI